MPQSNFTKAINDRNAKLAGLKELAEGDLGHVDQREIEGQQFISVGVASGSRVQLDASPHIELEPAKAVQGAICALQDFDAAKAKIVNNKHLSALGQSDALKSHQEVALLLTTNEYERLMDFEARLDDDEKKRYAPPAFGSHTSERDDAREIRQLLRGMSVEDRLDVLKRVEGGEVEEAVLRAILASPIGMAEDLVKSAAEAHKKFVDALDPLGRLRLNEFREALDWAYRQVAVLAANTLKATGLKDEALADLVRDRKGYRVFGLMRGDITAAARRAEMKKYLK